LTDVLLVEVDDGIAVVTMNRPDARNALNNALRTATEAAIADLDRRDDVRAIVLTGADPAFTAGLDLKEISSGGSSDSAGRDLDLIVKRHGPFGLLQTPLIGAVNGPAVTGGLEYALACDFLIASERARFADTHARVGIMPGWGLTIRLVEAVGLRRARQMSTTGNYVDAPTALSWGLVNEVVPHHELLSRARELARDIASIDPLGVRHVRETMRLTSEHPGDDAWDIESSRARAWFETFDPEQLAARRQAIQDRGRSQM
jgi:enoyl-CoA hydratase